jgi:hypothetical protein
MIPLVRSSEQARVARNVARNGAIVPDFDNVVEACDLQLDVKLIQPEL